MVDKDHPQYEEIKQLLEEKEKLVQEGKYLEAEEIKQKINELKHGNNRDKQISLHEAQVKERQTLEGDYETERKELEEKWDKKIQEFVEDGKKQEKELVWAMRMSSFTPCLARPFASSIRFSIGTETWPPRISGMAQKAQRRLQPSEIFR